MAEEGWMVADYFVGDENDQLLYLFSEDTLSNLLPLSPIVIYGEQGTGKTALSITLAVRWARINKARPLSFSSGHNFSKAFLEAIEIDDVGSFRNKHRAAKLLVIDELEPLLRSTASQKELVSTLDSLAEFDTPVIIATSTLPAACGDILPALASRLSAGFSIELLRPTHDTRHAIIQSLALELDARLEPGPIADFCATLAVPLKAADLRSIVTVFKQNLNESGSYDLAVVSQLVNQLLAGDVLTVATIAKVVARKMRVKLSDMRGSTRAANIVRARGLATLLARRLTPASLQQIGEFFGGRDHSTVLHSVRKTASSLESDTELSKALRDVQAELLT